VTLGSSSISAMNGCVPNELVAKAVAIDADFLAVVSKVLFKDLRIVLSDRWPVEHEGVVGIRVNSGDREIGESR
jgi:hypothetical protein